MIDLKKEIEKLKVNESFGNDGYSYGLLEGQNKGIKQCLQIIDQYNIGELSDGYHTFNSLYEQRMYLFATIVNQNKDKAWKSYKHEDGELCFGGGWFIVGIDTPNGSYTYHYENKYYDLFECEELECGKHWDGHTDKDVDRVLSLANYNIITAPKTIKLSEIVSKLEKHYNTEIVINRKPTSYYNCYILCRKSIAENEDYELLIRDNKIDDIDEFCCYPNDDNIKWLYTLWIAGTIIEDDLKDE